MAEDAEMKTFALLCLLALIGCGPSKDDIDRQESLATLKAGDKWPAPKYCELVESNEKWDKYGLRSGALTTYYKAFYTVDKRGTVLSVWRLQ
jgi:hypothetical protein